MDIFDFYGVNYNNEEDMISDLSEVLGVVFVPHDSSFWGDYFLSEIDGKNSYRLFQNFNPCENDWNYPDYQHAEWILEISEVSEMDDVFNKLLVDANPNVFFLYRSEVEALNYYKKYEFKDGNFKLISETFFKRK
ncbi:hypothetical protein [Acinetobacter oleivorans]|uniref:hypothetical protein n=1 Tax=Acinetobacter oleivorans TaxID=1148157 RepID=UPI003A8B4BA1